jgi:hypothetical protein
MSFKLQKAPVVRRKHRSDCLCDECLESEATAHLEDAE